MPLSISEEPFSSFLQRASTRRAFSVMRSLAESISRRLEAVRGTTPLSVSTNPHLSKITSTEPFAYAVLPPASLYMTVIQRLSLSKGISSSFFLSEASFSAVIPPFAAAISKAASVGSPVTVHSPPAVSLPRDLAEISFLVLIAALVQSVPHIKVSLRTSSAAGFIRFPPQVISPAILYPFPEKS